MCAVLQEGGITPIDQLKVGLRLEIQEELNPLNVWFVQVGSQCLVCTGRFSMSGLYR